MESLKERFPNLPEESLIALQNLGTFRGTMMSTGGMPANNKPQGIDDIINSAIHEGKKRVIINKDFGKKRKMKVGGMPMPEVGPPMPSVGPPPDVPIRASAIGSQGDMRNGMIAAAVLLVCQQKLWAVYSLAKPILWSFVNLCLARYRKINNRLLMISSKKVGT